MTAASEDDSNEARLKALETNVSEILARLRDLSPPAPAAMPEKPAGLKAKAKNRRSKEQCPDASCPRCSSRGGGLEPRLWLALPCSQHFSGRTP